MTMQLTCFSLAQLKA